MKENPEIKENAREAAADRSVVVEETQDPDHHYLQEK
jgi:hypothetical protein